MTKPTILICGNYGAGNFGDELILTGILKAARDLHPKEIIVTSGIPRETACSYGVTAIRFFPSSILSLLKSIVTLGLFRSIYYLLQSDVVLFGGGCLFNEKEPASIRIWYRQFQWFRLFGKKVIIIGQSFGSFTNQESIRKIKEVVNGVDGIFVRDKASRRLLAAHTNQEIHVCIDSALWLKKEDFQISSERDSEEKNKYVVLVIREWLAVDTNNLLNKMATLARYLFEKYQLSPRILVLQNGGCGDDQVSKKLYEKIEACSDTLPTQWSTVNDVATFYENASLIVSMRLHGGLMGLIMRRPTLFLNYDDKVGNLLDDLGLEELLVDPNADQLIPKAESLLSSASVVDFQKFQSKEEFWKYLTKIINSLK
ncbi:MAG: polysaccharide pyruvyl transferase family protein [Candidatus Peregrinibacteria bacterium]|nr:polysaccharide pyruvyl transferase family protein [Candidatus Peregrinibacteria bacterium]